MGVAITVLGAVRVTDGDGVERQLGGAKPRAVLAVLALSVGRVVSVTKLVDSVWGEDTPDTVTNTLQVNVSALRKAIAGCGVEIERTVGGYRLIAPHDSVDVHRFERLVAEGRAALRGHRLAPAVESLTLALSAWSGGPFDGLDAVPFVATARPALERARSTAVVERLECLVRLGRFDDAAIDAEHQLEREPFDERCWAVLITAHYWAGRQAEALAASGRARRKLADELGLDPGPDLVALERGVLDHALPAPHRPCDGAVGESGTRPIVLPSDRSLVGREAMVQQVLDRVVHDRFVSLVGLGGIGKTSVAITVAHRLVAIGHDVRFVDLSAVTDPVAAADVVLRAVAAEAASDPLDALSGWAARRDIVLILDNVEQIGDPVPLVDALLRSTSRVRLLVTSRRAVRVRGEFVVSVPPLGLEPSADDGAVIMFVQHATRRRAELADIDRAIAAEICGMCAGIPLAIELAALQLRVLSPAQLLGRLQRFAGAALDLPATDDFPQRQRSLRAVIDAATSMLLAGARAMLLRCAVAEGQVSIDLLESIADQAGVEGLGAIADLLEAGLISRVPGVDAVTVSPPVRQHVLAATSPAEVRVAKDELTAATRRLIEDVGDGWYGSDAQRLRSRLALDGAAIDTTLAALAERAEWVSVVEMSLLLAPYWLQQGLFGAALGVLDSIDAAGLPADLGQRLGLLRGTFASYISRGDTLELLEPTLCALHPDVRPDRLVVNAWCCAGAFHAHHHADDDLRRCVAAAREAAVASGDAALVALARDFEAYAAMYLGDRSAAIDLTLEAIADARRQGDRHALGLLLANAAEAMLQAERHEEARALAEEAFDLAGDVDLGVATGWVLLMYGTTALASGRVAHAWGPLMEHLRFVTERHPDPLLVGDSLALLAAAQADLGDPESAARTWGASVTIHREQGVDPDRRRLRVAQERWEMTRDVLGPRRFDALVLAGSTAADRVVTDLLERAARAR